MRVPDRYWPPAASPPRRAHAGRRRAPTAGPRAPRDAALLFRAACESPPDGGLLGTVAAALRAALPGVELGVLNWTTLDALVAQRRRWRGRG